jgi:hypothetical protein
VDWDSFIILTNESNQIITVNKGGWFHRYFMFSAQIGCFKKREEKITLGSEEVVSEVIGLRLFYGTGRSRKSETSGNNPQTPIERSRLRKFLDAAGSLPLGLSFDNVPEGGIGDDMNDLQHHPNN